MATRKAEMVKSMESQLAKKQRIQESNRSRLGRRVDEFGEEGQGSPFLGKDVAVPLQAAPLDQIEAVNVNDIGSDAVHTAVGEGFGAPPSPIIVNPRPNLGKRKVFEEAPPSARDAVDDLESLLKKDLERSYVLRGKEPLAFDGVPWAPNWKVSTDSSIMDMGLGGTSYELYKASMLPRDKARFVHNPHGLVEECGAHYLMQVGLSMHHLSLSCSYWKNEKLLVDQKLAKYMDRLERLEADLCDAKNTSKELRETLKNVAELFEESHIRHAMEMSEKEKHFYDQKKENELQQYMVGLREGIEKERHVAYNAGVEAGKVEFLKSKEYQNLVAQHRLNGARDFKRSAIFHQILIDKAASDTLIGFDKCKKLLISLKGIKEDFDLSRLNPCVVPDFEEEEEEDGGAEPPINFEEFKELAPVEDDDSEEAGLM